MVQVTMAVERRVFKCICGFLSKGRILVDYQQVGKDVDFPEDMGIIIETPGLPYARV